MKNRYLYILFILWVGSTSLWGRANAGTPTPISSFCLNEGVWQLQRASCVKETGDVISQPSYPHAGWTPAKVPGTVLNSYLLTGEWADPNFGDQQLLIPDSLFTTNFWYRTEFTIPEAYLTKRIWLNFDGINWKADIYLNGQKIGRIEGAYIRKKIDISQVAKADGKNALAVLIYKNDHPGEATVQHLNDPDGNGGIIGLDSPTILASIGWNWMPTIRGRNIGIWNDVYLSCSESVTMVDPFVKTILSLPDTTQADVIVEACLQNHDTRVITGLLEGEFEGKKVTLPVTLKGNETKTVTLSPRQFPELRLLNPKLWWPNGYGSQPLYTLKLAFKENARISDEKVITFGIRQYSYLVTNDNFRLAINGVPLIVRGGNWGMAESMMRCDSAGYDLRVRLHKEMNMNMIRNWIGMIGDDEFYEACDRYGIMVWDDFWLANPVDGPHPTNEKMFMENVTDKIRHFRNHPSIAIWAGRNEGYPPATLDSAMRIETSRLDGTRFYISHSAARPVSGLGPYENKDPKWYFTQRGTTFHSEQGIVVPPTLEGMKAMMPENKLWPINDMWGIHDWTQERVQIYTDDMIRCYGAPSGVADFCRKAQMMNMEACKALIESWQSNRGPGVLVWMSHPAWPSMICQTYDYFFEPTAAFFAFKKACEPIHILWRADTEQVQVANNTQDPIHDATAAVEVYDINGVKVLEYARPVSVAMNSLTDVLTLNYPETLSNVHFIRLVLTGKNQKVLSSNFYWRATPYMDYTSLDKMEKAKIQTSYTMEEVNGEVIMNVKVKNIGISVAVMLRLLVTDSQTKQRILPIYYEDNFFSLVAGEERDVTVSFTKRPGKSIKELLHIEGWNLDRCKVELKK